jgi:hypothetical protein
MTDASSREFDRQTKRLLDLGYAEAAGLSAYDFTARLEPLREHLPGLRGSVATLPFIIVLNEPRPPAGEAIARIRLNGKQGHTSMAPSDIESFRTIEGIHVPDGFAYLVLEVSTGAETLNVTPDDAAGIIAKSERSPLTLGEGIALLAHFPDIMEGHNAFSMLGSRCGDRRVTALWMSKGRPRLGWCWAGNPHTWLGSASCARRVRANRQRTDG